MDKTLFLTFYHFVENHSKTKKYFIFMGKILPNLVVYAYFIFLLFLWTFHKDIVKQSILIPFLSLLFITVLRILINRKRPFEVFSIVTPLSHTKGHSFPSRHTASAVIIACTFGHFNIITGIIFGIIALLIGISRVAVGLHYPLDVIAGAFISIFIAYFGFFYQ